MKLSQRYGGASFANVRLKCWARRREGVAAGAARIRQDVKKSNLDATTKNKDGKKENGILKKKLNRKKMRRSFFLDLDLPPKTGD